MSTSATRMFHPRLRNNIFAVRAVDGNNLCRDVRPPITGGSQDALGQGAR